MDDELHHYRCSTCGQAMSASLSLMRVPALIPHPDGGFMHYIGDTLELCGPMKQVDTP